MLDVVIRCENLSKLYRIGEKRERYRTLRDSIATALTVPFRGFQRKGAADSKEKSIVWALKDVSFEVKRGEILGVIGRNGAGKSTLLKILSRITDPTKGFAEIRGRVNSLLEVGTGFHPELTGRENIFLNAAILGMKRWEILKKFDEIVSFSEVEKFIDTPVKFYSSGMSVRLAFSVAAHLQPEILLVDEVLAVGDVGFQKRCLGKMEGIASEGRTILFVSHNMGVVSALCDRCILFKEGNIECTGRPQETVSCYLGTDVFQSVVKVRPEMRNRGGNTVRLCSCEISNLKGEPSNSFLIGEDFSLEIHVDVDTPMKTYFWIIVCDAEGKPVLSSHQGDYELIQIDVGSYRLKCTTRGIRLLPGRFSISAGAFDSQRTFLEWVDNIQRFEVMPSFMNGKPFDYRWGLVDQKVEWKLVPDEKK